MVERYGRLGLALSATISSIWQFYLWLGGFLHDVSVSYTIPFMIAFGNFIASVAMVWCLQLLKTQRA